MTGSDQTTIHIRPITQEDLDEMTSLHFECFTRENNFSMRFGWQFVLATYRFFLDDEKSFGFVAYANGKMAGLITGRLDYYTTDLNKYRRPYLIKALLLNPFIIADHSIRTRLKPLIKRLFSKKNTSINKMAPSHMENKTATLASLCVHPLYTKYKLSDLLIEKAEVYAKDHEMKILRTGIAKSNLLSRFAFKKRGYQEDQIISGENGLFYYIHL